MRWKYNTHHSGPRYHQHVEVVLQQTKHSIVYQYYRSSSICRMSHVSSHPAIITCLPRRCRHNTSKLTPANLALHNESTAARDQASGNHGMEQFHNEQDQYRRFLVTGDSPHQREERAKKLNGLSASANTLGKILLPWYEPRVTHYFFQERRNLQLDEVICSVDRHRLCGMTLVLLSCLSNGLHSPKRIVPQEHLCIFSLSSDLFRILPHW